MHAAPRAGRERVSADRAELERRKSEAFAEWMAAGRPDTRDAARKRYRRASAALDTLNRSENGQ